MIKNTFKGERKVKLSTYRCLVQMLRSIRHYLSVATSRNRQPSYSLAKDAFNHAWKKFNQSHQHSSDSRRITSWDVRKALHVNPYCYYYANSKGVIHSHDAVQPKIKELGYNSFVIYSPYKDLFNHHIKYVLVQDEKTEELALITNPLPSHLRLLDNSFKQLNNEQEKAISAYKSHLAVEYEIGQISKHIYYVPLFDRSIQSAYYRLNTFEITFYHLLDFLHYTK